MDSVEIVLLNIILLSSNVHQEQIQPLLIGLLLELLLVLKIKVNAEVAGLSLLLVQLKETIGKTPRF